MSSSTPDPMRQVPLVLAQTDLPDLEGQVMALV